MAMHKPKKTKRFQDGGDVNEAEMKRRGLDISNRAREEGTEKTGFFQRLREGNIDDPNSAAYKKYGAGRARLDDQIVAAKEKLAGEVQEMVKAKTPAAAVQSSKASDGDVDERDRRIEAAASAPKRMPTRPSQETSGRKPSVSKAPVKAKPSTAPAASTSRGRGAEKGSAPKQTMGGPYRDEGRNRPAPAAPEKRPGTALPINPSVLRQREEAEKKRDAARAAKRKESEAKEEKFTKDLSSDPGQMAIRKEREAAKSMSPSERSAARGRAVKEFFGINTKKPLDAKGATIQSMDTDMMRTAGRTAAKEQGQKRKVESSYKKGGSVSSASKRADGIAQRGKTRGKVY
jgi:hypothetical protein